MRESKKRDTRDTFDTRDTRDTRDTFQKYRMVSHGIAGCDTVRSPMDRTFTKQSIAKYLWYRISFAPACVHVIWRSVS